MANNLAKSTDFRKVGELLFSNFKYNSKIGAHVAQAAWNNGRSIIRGVTDHGAKITTIIDVPEITSTEQRENLILDLMKWGFTQVQTAAILDTSQSKVSRTINRLAKK